MPYVLADLDSFDRADTGAGGGLGSTEGAGQAWTEAGGTDFEILSNQAHCPTITGYRLAYVDAGDDDHAIEATLTGTTRYAGLAVRVGDSTHYVAAYRYNATNWNSGYKNGGSTLAAGGIESSPGGSTTGVRLRVEAIGADLYRYYEDDVLVDTFSLGTNMAGSGVGLIVVAASTAAEDWNDTEVLRAEPVALHLETRRRLLSVNRSFQ